MFDDFLIASTAVSSFNNASLLNPFFFTTALLSLPLFLLVYLYGRDFVSKFGWTNQNIENKVSFWSATILGLWILLFGGNYAVIRGGISLLPVLISIILFGLMTVVSNCIVRLKYIEKFYDKKYKWLLFGALILCAACSGIMTWWGVLLQISAILCGIIVGCRLHKETSWVVFITLILGMMTTLILMQPEYFRFGQLGHLTLVHLTGIILSGFFVVTTVVSRYVKARDKIHHTAYIKLKWLFRIVSLLALILFIATESVPVFLGLLLSSMFLEALTIYHSKKIVDGLYKQSWAWLMVIFGILIVCPVISALGIVYLVFTHNVAVPKDFLRLL